MPVVVDKQLSEWYPRERKRRKGRPTQIWNIEMRRVGHVTRQRVAANRIEWKKMSRVYCNMNVSM